MIDARGDLAALLAAHVAPVAPAALAGVRADVVLDAGHDGAATLVIWDGRVRVHPGSTRAPTTRIRGPKAALVAIVEGRTSGVEAFLDGHIDVRGDVALSLQIDGLLGPARQGRIFPSADVVDAAGIRTALLEAGPRTAPAVVLLHGLGASNASMLPVLRDLSGDFRLLAPDLPGHGASAAPRARYDAAFFARWLEALLDVRGVPSAVVVGNSLGGRIGLELAFRRPDRTSALVLLAPAVAFRRLRQAVPLVRLLRPGVVGLAPALPIPEAAVVAAIRMMFARPERLSPVAYRAASGEWARVYRSRAHRVAFASALQQIYVDDAFGDEGFWRRLPTLDVPALFVWGERDVLVPAAFARHVMAAVPSARSVVLEKCGHVPQFERPEETGRVIRQFLREVETGAHAGGGSQRKAAGGGRRGACWQTLP